MTRTQLVIFDSDGVLVDSETIALDVLAAAARSEGAHFAAGEALSLFRGLKIADCVLEIEKRAGRAVRASFINDVRAATAAAFEAGLRPIEGVHLALAAITVPVCVASNGPMAKLNQTLGLTGLLERFQGRIFSAYEVGSWKPEPGLFLHAAAALSADPAHCVVVEDSAAGVAAAHAAGMRVLGYGGAGQESRAELHAAGAEVFTAMSELPALLS